MSNNRIFIIGGSGFVGSSLRNLFERNNSSFCIGDKRISEDNKNEVFVDVTKPKTLSKLENYDVIINLAAEHRDDVFPISKYDQVNVGGAKNVCNSARKFGINKIIFTSSVAVYGHTKRKTSESGKINFFNDYGRTKYEAEKVYIDWWNEDPKLRSLVIVRPTVIFGPNNRGNVFNLINSISNNRFIMIGNGKNVKSMAFVENVSSFIDYSLKLDKNFYLFNYIDEPSLDMNEIVYIIKRNLFNSKSIGMRIPKQIGMPIGVLADFFSKITKKALPISKIRIEKFLASSHFYSDSIPDDFIAPFSLEDGLNKTIDHEFPK